MSAAAQVSTLSFTSPPQSIEINAPSAAVTLTVQDANGDPISGGIPTTGCIALTTSSQTGQFSSSATNWNPVTMLTMNKSTSKRSFFYQDSASGTFVLTATFATKPSSVSDSCVSWPQSQWGTVYRASQTITVGAGGTELSQAPQSVPEETQPTPLITSTTQEPILSSGAGSVPLETLTVQINTQPVVVVGAGSFFSASAHDSHGAKGTGARYLWNFGDGATSQEQNVFHTYTYPGKYVVFLTVASGEQTGLGRAMVEVIPAPIGLIAEPDGSVVISNQSMREVNIGMWNITSDDNTFSIPQNTILLGGQSIQFSTDVIRFAVGADVVLRYPNNVEVSVIRPRQVSSDTNLSSDADNGSDEDVLNVRGTLPERPFQSSSTRASTTQQLPHMATQDLVATPALLTEAQNLFEKVMPYGSYLLGALGFILIGIGLFSRKTQ